ncbi:hypothetical protein ADUPG1_006893, partial [Aduncisulcus paluster]
MVTNIRTTFSVIYESDSSETSSDDLVSVVDMTQPITTSTKSYSPVHVYNGEELVIDRDNLGVFLGDYLSDDVKEAATSVPSSIRDSFVDLTTLSNEDNLLNVHDKTFKSTTETVPNPLLFAKTIQPEGSMFVSPASHFLDADLAASVASRANFDPRSTIEYKTGISLGMRRGIGIVIDTTVDSVLSSVLEDEDIAEYAIHALKRTTDLILSQFTDNDYFTVFSTDGVFNGVPIQDNENTSLSGLYRSESATLDYIRDQMIDYFDNISPLSLCQQTSIPRSMRVEEHADTPRMEAIVSASNYICAAQSSDVTLETVIAERVESLIGFSTSQQNMSDSHPLPAGSPLYLVVISLGSIFHESFPTSLSKQLTSNNSNIIPIILRLTLEQFDDTNPSWRQKSPYFARKAACTLNGMYFEVDVLQMKEGLEEEEVSVDIIHRFEYTQDAKQLIKIERDLENFFFAHCFSIFRYIGPQCDGSMCSIKDSGLNIPISMHIGIEPFL